MQPRDIGEHSWHPDFDATLLAPAGASGVVVLKARQPVPDHVWGSVLLLGNFDGLHIGHMELLTAARRHAALLKAPLGIMSCEPHPKQFFTPDNAAFRISSADTKEIIFTRLGIDLLFMPIFNFDFASQTPHQFAVDILVEQLGVKAVVVGEDFRFGNACSGSIADLRSFGAQHNFDVIVIPDLILEGQRVSSTLIRSWINGGELEKVNAALHDTWITKIISNGSPAVTFEPGIILPPAGRYAARLWNAKGDLIANVRVNVGRTREANIENRQLSEGVHLISDWQIPR